MRLAIFFLARHPRLDVIFLHLPQSKICAAVDNDMVRKFKFLQKLLRVFGYLLVQADRFFVICLAQNDLFVFEKFMYAKDAFRILAMASRFAPEAGRKTEKLARQVFLL